MKLTVLDQCEKADQPAQTRFAKTNEKTGTTLFLDFCGHHTREFGPNLIGLGWELHDASDDAVKEAKLSANAVSV